MTVFGYQLFQAVCLNTIINYKSPERNGVLDAKRRAGGEMYIWIRKKVEIRQTTNQSYKGSSAQTLKCALKGFQALQHL